MSETFMTIKEVSAYLSVKYQTLYSWVGKGVIPCYRMGRLIRFRKQEIDLWLEQKRQKAEGFVKRIGLVVEEAHHGLF